MTPPSTFNVIDKHDGFTAITRSRRWVPDGLGWKRAMVESDTLWRPSALLKKTTIGELVSFDEKSFYQVNNDVTKAIYKVAGYSYKVACWFDNKTGARIA